MYTLHDFIFNRESCTYANYHPPRIFFKTHSSQCASLFFSSSIYSWRPRFLGLLIRYKSNNEFNFYYKEVRKMGTFRSNGRIGSTIRIQGYA